MTEAATQEKRETEGRGPRGALAAAGRQIGAMRRATKRRYTAEDKIRIVIAGLKREQPVTELCRYEGITTALYYGWLREFMEAGKRRLQGDTTRDATRTEVENLRRENERLKGIIGDQTLEITLLKKSVLGSGAAGTWG